MTEPDAASTELRQAAAAARQTHVRADVLPQAPALTARVDRMGAQDLAKLPPVERFVALQLRTRGEEGLPAEVVVPAYADALRELPADWWGGHGALTSPAAQRLRVLPGADAMLLGLLEDSTPLRYVEDDGEAQTEVADWELTVADLAAELLALRHGLTYEVDEEDARVRAAARATLAAQVGAER